MGSTKTVLEAKVPAKTSEGKRFLKWAIPLALGLLILVIPRPEGLTPAAWHYFALFIAVIAALITEPFPGPVVGFVGIAFGGAMVFVGKTPGDGLRWALSGFSNSTVWLIYAASLFALGYEVTGLGRRIALILVHKLGGKTLGLGYAVALSDLVLAPFTSSEHRPRQQRVSDCQQHSAALRLSPTQKSAQDRFLHHVDRLCRAVRHQFDVPDRAGAQRSGG